MVTSNANNSMIGRDILMNSLSSVDISNAGARENAFVGEVDGFILPTF